MEKQGKVCTKCGEWKPLEEYNKKKTGKYGRQTKCRECQKEQNKQWRENNKEYIKGQNKRYYQNNKECVKEHIKQYKKNNKEHIKEQKKQYRENNKENIKKINKQYYQNNKEKNLQYISTIVEQINLTFKQLNLPIYGYIYKFENVKTNRVYIGQTINSLKKRYNGSNIIQRWIKDRLKYNGQKFKEELIEEDFVVTETLDVAFCQYHLDKLEAYYIGKYDSYNNGYNNEHGNHKTDDGLEEFNKILEDNGLKFIDGKLVKIV